MSNLDKGDMFAYLWQLLERTAPNDGAKYKSLLLAAGHLHRGENQMTYYKWYADWKEHFPSLRLGQHFVNQYINHSWPELYYCESDERSGQMIFKWLTDHCYFPNMPTKINNY